MFVSWDFKLLQVSMILDFIQNLKFSIKIHLKPWWVPSFTIASKLLLFKYTISRPGNLTSRKDEFFS